MSDSKAPHGLRALSRIDFLKIATAAGGAVAISSTLTAPKKVSAQKGPPKSKIDTPGLECAGSTKVSINIKVCAGATGAPAGFSLHWMRAADFTGIWPDSDSICHASFAGNANLSRYNLGPNQCVVVNIGEFLFDSGASTNCAGMLACGTEYVFRAFAHANGGLQRSEFTAERYCSTLPCDSEPEGCTYTQGYWKTHGPVPTGNNLNEWPVTSLPLGTVLYTDLQLQSIFDTPAAGNGLIALAHQLIAAKLNVANGADATSIAAVITAADALIGNRVVPPVGSGALAPATTSALTDALMKYNEGATGPGHCSA